MFCPDDFSVSQVTEIENNVSLTDENLQFSTNTSCSVANLDSTPSCSTLNSEGTRAFKLTPEQVPPYPKVVRTLSNKGRKKKISAILTSTPEKDKKEQEQIEKEKKRLLIIERKEKARERKEKAKGQKNSNHIRKILQEESSESEIEHFCEESDDNPMEFEYESPDAIEFDNEVQCAMKIEVTDL